MAIDSRVIVTKKCACCGTKLVEGAPHCPLCQSKDFVPITQHKVPVAEYAKP